MEFVENISYVSGQARVVLDENTQTGPI